MCLSLRGSSLNVYPLCFVCLADSLLLFYVCSGEGKERRSSKEKSRKKSMGWRDMIPPLVTARGVWRQIEDKYLLFCQLDFPGGLPNER